MIAGNEGDDLMIGGPGSDRLRATSRVKNLLGDDEDTERAGESAFDWRSNVEAAIRIVREPLLSGEFESGPA